MSDQTPRQLDQPQGETPPIRYASYGELRIYKVDERDLDALASGSPASLELNLAIAFLSVSVSLITALVTTSIESRRLFDGFFIIVVGTAAAGVVLVSRCVRSHRSSRKLLNQIKARMPPKDGIQEPLSGGTESPGGPGATAL